VSECASFIFAPLAKAQVLFLFYIVINICKLDSMDKKTRVLTHAVFTKPVKIRSVRPPFFDNEQMLPDEAKVTKNQ
jgi:hypothetical protein